ncbi:helix-turn-helix domain-containing protein [Bifidobacterium crudilactis]|jgi:AcrR family transcriptional regulator|uniref:TetR/AcrR family transcriptional regulator n=1 Tax=Bifidobacterium crudilactis TaxID=327277 RepID=UPI002F35F152
MTRTANARQDARDNTAKLQSAALVVFARLGINAPLEAIAKEAGVSIGTLYNRYATREELLEALMPGAIEQANSTLTEALKESSDPKSSLELFFNTMMDLQRTDSMLNAALHALPNTTASTNSDGCDELLAIGYRLLDQCHTAKVLSEDFGKQDLFNILWLFSKAICDPAAPNDWEHTIRLMIDTAWVRHPKQQ